MTDQGSTAPAYAAAVDKAAALTRRTLQFFPIRVVQHFQQRNGMLLSAGMSYQGLFALFALLYIAFAAVGIWLGGSTTAITAIIDIVNSYVPGLISDTGIAEPDDVISLTRDLSSLLWVTAAIAIVAAWWTAMTAVTYTRLAVRDIFGLAPDTRNFAILKVYDFASAVSFGLALLIGAALSVAGVWALTFIFELLDWSMTHWIYSVGVRLSSTLVAFAIDTLALAMLMRFLAGTSIHWRTIWPGAALGGGAIVVLQLAAGLLLSNTPSNPLLATFAVIIGLLLWCRWIAMVVLLAAAWIATTARDRDQPLTEEEMLDQKFAHQRALVLAARVQLNRAQSTAARAHWWQKVRARRFLRHAEEIWWTTVADARAAGLDVDAYVRSLKKAEVIDVPDAALPVGSATRGRR
ncbi:YihY/virulence factor BrkB family protein [Microbacterium sp. YY-01]|uniref:YihY/virulence factor BrkB family protein n=1 Tax=Microbacterium sp. YY-01 TaxID=3421634 RepID=UPI003D16937C